MSAAWDAMIAAEIAQGAPIVAVPGIAPSEPRELPVFSSLAGLATIRAGRAFPTLPDRSRGRFSLSSPE